MGLLSIQCKGCNTKVARSKSRSGYCPSCLDCFADELLECYAWCRQFLKEIEERRDIPLAVAAVDRYKPKIERINELRRILIFTSKCDDDDRFAMDGLAYLQSIKPRAEQHIRTLAANALRIFNDSLAIIEKTKNPDTGIGRVLTFMYQLDVFRALSATKVFKYKRSFEDDELFARNKYDEFKELLEAKNAKAAKPKTIPAFDSYLYVRDVTPDELVSSVIDAIFEKEAQP